MTTAQQYLDKQREYLGYHGGPPNGNNTPFGAWTGAQNLAWCGSFQLECAHEVGLQLPGKVNPLLVQTLAGYAEYQRQGRAGQTPSVGAHVFYDWSGRRNPGNIHHVECVESVVPGGIVTIGGNVNSAVQRVRRSLSPYVVGFGYPVFAAAPVQPGKPATPPAGTPIVSLARVLRAAHTDPAAPQGHQTAPADVRLVEQALQAEGLLTSSLANDGSYGSSTVAAYAKWQQRLGFRGRDADGFPGTQSLTKLGARHGWRVGA